ncbi:hypothetical protein MNBD_GAMMA26-855 [hydrothermal vent metagenome]|uniref:Transmembrane protein n=1 Tax=hydrothermal vent metagenome TaxID=652676 RepID=A0A3B1B103_9ZZZZ
MKAIKVDAGEGLQWLSCGWQLFTKAAGVLVLMGLILFALSLVLNIIPLIGTFIFLLILPVIVGGLLLAIRTVDEGSNVEIMVLFHCFQDNSRLNPLLILGAIMLAASAVAGIAMMLYIGNAIMVDFGPGTLLGLLVVLVLQVFIAMAFFYAIPLVTFELIAPIEALKTSYNACLLNIIPLLLFSIIYIILFFLAIIPFGLGLILLIPVVFCAVYCSYKSIFRSSEPGP